MNNNLKMKIKQKILVMLLKKGINKQGGFSLTELLVVVIILGIFAAISVPNLTGLFAQNQVKQGFEAVESAIKEAQRQAMRRGKRCKIKIDQTTGTIDVKSPDGDGNYSGCLLSERELPDGVVVKTNYRTPVITFSYRGNTNSAGTIVVYNSNGRTKAQKCLAISLGLGIMRNGDHTGDVSSSVSASKCKKIT
jgi:prepilin-type N-terminal cleavage/methylation domain-containing protein